MAAKCSQRQDSPWHAAKHLEKAAEASKETQDWSLTIEYLKQAALAYREAGRPQSAAETLAKGARMLEERNPEVNSSLCSYLAFPRSLRCRCYKLVIQTCRECMLKMDQKAISKTYNFY